MHYEIQDERQRGSKKRGTLGSYLWPLSWLLRPSSPTCHRIQSTPKGLRGLETPRGGLRLRDRLRHISCIPRGCRGRLWLVRLCGCATAQPRPGRCAVTMVSSKVTQIESSGDPCVLC